MVAVAAAALLTACGGGGNNGETKVKVTSLKVVGASLADSGTTGHKFTVQSAGSENHLVYSERIAASYGISGFCPAYTSDLSGRKAGCTNFAVEGSAINFYTGPTTARSLVKQLEDVGNGGFSNSDLLLVGEGSANDAATLVGAFIQSTSNFQALTGTLLGGTVVASYVGTGDYAGLGVAYMNALADKLVKAIKENALDKGATRVAVLNTLDITKTPRFVAALALVSANSGGGSTGAAAAATVQNLAQTWVKAYNARLDAQLAAYDSKVKVVDFYKGFNDEMADPLQYGLNNVTASVCDQVYAVANSYTPSVGSAGTTALGNAAVVSACTDAAASAITPTVGGDGTSNWWRKYLFADYFHPTPYGHQLLAQLVAKRLTEAGWL